MNKDHCPDRVRCAGGLPRLRLDHIIAELWAAGRWFFVLTPEAR